jgi:endonuclease YncB( thermonuclease family)
MGVRDVRAQAKAYFKLEHNKPKFEPVDKAHIEHRVKTTLEGKNRDVEDLGYRRIEGIVSSYEKKIAQGKYDAFSPDAPDLVGYRAHSTSDQGLEAILATKRLLPGSTNVQHADGVGVYASMLKSGRADLRAAPATSGGYGKNTFFIKNTKNSDAVFSPAYGDSGHEITRNQSLELFGVRNISGNAPSRMGKQAPLSAQIHTDASIIRQKNASFSATKSSYEKSLSRLEGGGDSSWSSMDNFISSSNNYQKALEEIQPRSTTEAFRNYFKSTPTVDLSTVNRNKYFVVDDVVAHDYNPNHMGRPTKLVKEEHGASLAFSNAEALGFSDPAKRGVMESVFGLAKDIEAMGGQLHIKGGVARNRLVGKIRPEWAKESKDIDLLVTGGIPTDKIYGAMEGRQAFFDVETTSTLEHFFPTTDSSLNQAVIRVGGDGSENLIFTKGAAEDILAGRQRYLDNSDSGRASQRIAKRESDFPGLTTTRGEIPGMNEPYKIIHGFDDAYNTIEGFPHSGIAGTTRPKNTAFASPWQGAANDIKRTLGIMNQSSIARGTGANDGISKRESDDRQVAQIGIRSYAVEDADTVKLMLQGGGEMSLRLAGIDAPETTHEGFAYNPLQDQPYGQEATSRLEELMAAQGDMKVLFSPDSSQTYGRTAGLIVAEDGTNVNLELVRAGAAAALPYGPSSDRIYSTGEFTKAQAQAQESGEGMWGMGEWQAAQNAMGTKRRMTHNTLSDPQDIYQNFRAAAVLHRMRNPDASLSGMMAAGGKDDFNIHEGLNHGWANANRRADIGDFGSGYVIDKVVKRPARSFAVKAKLMNANNNARSYVKSMFDNENHIGHHRS